MQYRKMGRTGLKVSSFCLGTMTFGRQVEEKESIQIMVNGYLNLLKTWIAFAGVEIPDSQLEIAV